MPEREDVRRPRTSPPDPSTESEPARERERAQRFRGTRELLTGLLDPDGPFRRGQEMVTGVTQATKDELMRIVSAEVRNFLDKMDAVDLLQQVISGLTVDVNMQIRFSRASGEGVRSEVTRSDARIGSTPRPRARNGKERREPAGEDSDEPPSDEDELP